MGLFCNRTRGVSLPWKLILREQVTKTQTWSSPPSWLVARSLGQGSG